MDDSNETVFISASPSAKKGGQTVQVGRPVVGTGRGFHPSHTAHPLEGHATDVKKPHLGRLSANESRLPSPPALFLGHWLQCNRVLLRSSRGRAELVARLGI